MTTLILFLALLVSDGETTSPFTQLSPDHFTVKRLPKLFSPTAVTIWKDQIYLGCDLLDSRPGIYRYDSESGKSTLVAYMPQTELRGLSSSDGKFVAASARIFSTRPDDWQGQALLYEIAEKRKLQTIDLQIPAKCVTGEFSCGLSSVVLAAPDKLLAITINPSELNVYTRGQDGHWSNQHNLMVTVNRQSVEISEAALIGEQLVLLARDRWALCAVAMSEVLAEDAWRIDATPVFDLNPLKKAFPIGVTSLVSSGYAEGFAFDKGRLLVVLDNRGYNFTMEGEESDRKSPVLVIYEPPKKPEPIVPKSPSELPETKPEADKEKAGQH